MLCICNASGDIIAVSPSSLHQGSIDANKIILLAPFARASVVSVLVTLPNRLSLYPQLAQGEDDPTPYNMAAIDLDLGINNVNGVAMNAWSYTLAAPMTQYSGTLTLQFLFTLPGGGTLASSAANIPVQRGSAWIAPTVTAEDINTISEYLAAAQRAADNANTDAKEAAMWATGEDGDGHIAEEGDPQYENNAKYYAEDAGRSREYAWVYQERAENAKIAAQIAQDNSEIAKNAAEAAQNAAASAQTGAEEAAARAEGYANIVGAGAASLTANLNSNYVLTLTLYDAEGRVMSSPSVDFPVESSITNIAYDAASKDLILTLQNGNTTRVPLDDIVSGLATEAALNAGLAAKRDKITAALKLYGTDSNGDQTAYEIATTTGNSQLAFMTQAAVTAALNALGNRVTAVENGVTTLQSKRLHRYRIIINAASAPVNGVSRYVVTCTTIIYAYNNITITPSYMSGGIYLVSGFVVDNNTNTTISLIKAEAYSAELYVSDFSGRLYGFSLANGDTFTYTLSWGMEV